MWSNKRAQLHQGSHQKLQNLGGDGGVIVMDKFGNMAISFNTEGMYRAYISSDGKPIVEIY